MIYNLISKKTVIKRNMKIIVTGQTYYPTVSGAAIFTQRLAENMAKRGHKVYLFIPSDNGQTYYKQENNITEFRFNSLPNPLRKDHKVSPWPYKKMLKIAREIKPDVLHTHDPLNIGYSTVRIGEKLDIPTVMTLHALPIFISSYFPKRFGFNDLIEDFVWWVGRKATVKCDLIISPSKWAAKSIKKREEKLSVRVISNGVDTGLFKPCKSKSEKEKLKKKHGFSLDKKIIIYVGRLGKEKSPEILLKSLPFVLEKQELDLVFVGSGNMAEKLKYLANSLGIEDNVIFKGEIPYNELPDFYKAADVFATTSAIENQSSVVLEAASSGLPIVAFNSGGMPEVIKDKVNGILVSYVGSETFAKGLITVLGDDDLARKMGQESRKFAESNCLKKTYKLYEEVYSTLVNGKNGYF